MKIGILTFHASHNFGSMLQNYALQQFLIAEGHVVETINLRIKKQKYMYNHPLCIGKNNKTIRALLGRLKDPKWVLKESKGWYLFEQFLKKNIILTKEYHNWEEIERDLPKLKYDAIITGGDQIWNTFCYDFDWSYFLPGDVKPTKKISYSPSIGEHIKDTYEDKERARKIKSLVQDFNFISCRELDGCSFIESLTNKPCTVCADPTIIVEHEAFSKFIGNPIIPEPYIYYYTPPHVKDIKAEEIAKELAKKHGLKIVESFASFRQNSGMTDIASGPKEFLNLLKNAEIVVGKSFHLVVFSILFHKNFATIRDLNDPRVVTISQLLNIKQRNIETADDFDLLNQIDYNEVDKEIFKLKESSIAYLRKALGSR